MNPTYCIIDFDSTIVKVEALDELAKIALAKNPQKEKITSQIEEITRLGMDGSITFSQSLEKRLGLFSPTREHVEELVKLLKKNITPSVLRNKIFFKKNKDTIYIISGGFKEYIVPLAKLLGIEESHVLANTFIWKGNKAISYDKKNLLSKTGGKVKQIQKLKLQGRVVVVGDGYTDYEIKKEGLADTFNAFVENVHRDKVVAVADTVVKSFDEFLYIYNLPRSISYPKSKIKALLLENIDTEAVRILKEEGYSVETLKTALNEKELNQKIKDIALLGIRSKTEVTEKVLNQAPKLLAIGAFCIGTNQINIKKAAEKGIVVFNAPYSNTRSVVELVIGEIIMLFRGAIEKNNKLHNGIWDKSSKGNHEIRGKKLGIIGYGNIGSQLSVLAENLGMEVYFYDASERLALGNAHKCSSMDEVLKKADIITIHVDGRSSNNNLIGDKEFSRMKDGVLLLNLSRGHIVDLDSLTKYIKSGKIAGAAIDVFPYEPKNNDEKFTSSLQGLQNVILTPHIGGSTEEAQKSIGEFVANKLIQFINTGNTTLSVNFPNIQLGNFLHSHRLIHIHKNTPGILAHINTILANHKINITGQFLGTNDDIGYVITDVEKDYSSALIKELKSVSGTIRLRVLY